MEKIRKKRIQKNKPNFFAGDIFKSKIKGIDHICILLKNDTTSGRQDCLPFCNFTGSNIPKGEYAIDISSYKFPDDWFTKKKENTWIRFNNKDCIYSININKNNILGNVKDDYNKLWDDICNATVNCGIAERLNEFCNCKYKLIRSKLSKKIKEEPECECET